MKNEFPLSRFEDIVVQELKDEVLVCDLKSNRVFCLNQTAGEVWMLCDGKTDVKEIAGILSKKLKTNVSEDLVLFSLDELSNHNLLAKKVSTERLFIGVSRREVIKRICLSTMAALPIITAIAMPTVAQAQSGCPAPGGGGPIPNGCACLDCSECESGCCFGGVCSGVGLCVTPAICAVDADCPCGLFCCAPGNPVCSPGC